MRNFTIVIGLSLLVFSMSAHGKEMKKCVLPSPDERSSASPPGTLGKIVWISESRTTIKISASARIITVFLPAKLRLFSTYGGALEASDLKVGEYIQVWEGDCSKPKDSKIHAQVILVER